MKAVPSFATLLQRFFTERLVQQRQASPHTISAYRDTFRLLLKFTSKRLRKPPDRIAFEDIDAPLIGAFLNDLQKSRGITTRSHNARLAAIRSFFNFAAFEMPSVGANPACAGNPHQTICAGTDRVSYASGDRCALGGA
jgi:site-specific recombinase XerD